MIKSFSDKEAEKLFLGVRSRKLPPDIQMNAKKRLDRIHAATCLDDLRVPPSHRLESLIGNRRGQHSIRINDQWRVCFVWQSGDAFNIEIVDYHD